MIREVQEQFDNGATVTEITEKFSLKRDTLQKAIRAGRLHFVEKKILKQASLALAQKANVAKEMHKRS